MNLLTRNSVPLLAILVSGLASLLLLPVLPSRIPVGWGIGGTVSGSSRTLPGAFLNPAGMLLIYLFFSGIPYIDRARVRQLRDVGIYTPLRNGAVLLFFYTHVLTLGIGSGLFSPDANVLVGVASLLVLLAGDAALSDPSGRAAAGLSRLVPKEGGASRLARGLVAAGALGLAGTFLGRLQGLVLAVPVLAVWALARRGWPSR